MRTRQDYAGRTFGRITLDAPSETRPGYWRGRCSCGNPVEKRIDNLKRPGDHSCGQCTTPTPGQAPDLEHRVRALEELVARLLGQATVAAPSPTGPAPQAERTTPPPPEPRTSRYHGVTHDGEFWQARAANGRVLFWGDTEEEAAYAARVYLEITHATYNRRVITDAELTLPQERRERIRDEVIEAL